MVQFKEEHSNKEHKYRFSTNFYNPITYVGVFLSIFVITSEILLFGIDFFSSVHSIYLGIFTYVILPVFLILGLLLIPIGAHWKHKRVVQHLDTDSSKAIHIDLSKRTHQNGVLIFIIGTAVILIMSAVGSYKAFHYTESTQFCGVLCHQVMQPEYQAHMRSSHARVKCVECHIGGGAGWYVHYKMAGVRMMAKTFQNSYTKPIPAPVETLRPAKEICEQCHSPEKTFSAIQIKKNYYADDSSQTPPWSINMLMKTGGKNGESGLHTHMFYGDEIYYVPQDAKRQNISWIKTVKKNGEVKIFTTKNSPYKVNPPPAEKIRKMDCMDCHNRPAHSFEAPDPLVNQAMSDGGINPAIPMIKGKAVEVLTKDYKSLEEATKEIRSSIEEYYAKKQEVYYGEHKESIDKAIKTILTIYQRNFYPEMKVRWEAYPDNNSHMISLGCFRCHDDEHKTKTGEVISRDCTICHIITEQGSGEAIEKSTEGLEFKHPFQEGDDSWKGTNCSDCHTGGS